MTPETGPYDSVSTQDTSGARIIDPTTLRWDVDLADVFGQDWAPEVGQGTEAVTDSMADDIRRHQASGRIVLPPTWWNDFRLITGTGAVAASTNFTGVLKNSPGILHGIMVSGAGTGWVVTFTDGFDNTQLKAAPNFRYLTAMGTGPFFVDFKFMNALTVSASGTTAGEMVILWL